MRTRRMVLALSALAALTAAAGEADGAAHRLVLPSARFILQLGVLVFAAKTGGRLFERARLPHVLGELLAGLLVGPFLLGGLAIPLFPDGLMADAAGLLTRQGPVYGMMTVALVVLFFLVGLDTDLRQLPRAPAGGVAAGVAGFAACFAVTLAGLVRLAPALTGSREAWGWTSPRALLVSTVVSVTSVGVLARVLAERRRLESAPGAVALTAAMTDNVLGLLLFTVFSGASQAVADGAAPSLALLGAMTLRALLCLGAVAAIGFPVARRVNARALREKNYTGAFVVSAACLLVAGGLTGVLGLSVMGGAYVMGVAFSVTDLRHEIRERLEFVRAVLVPACFAAVGMQVNPNLLADTPVVAAALALTAAALLAKLVGNALPAAFAGLNVTGCLRVGVAAVPRGALSLALLAAVVGLADLPPGVFFSVVLLVALSCLGAPGLAERAFARGGAGTRGRCALPAVVTLTFRFPSHQAATLMINRAVAIFEDDGFYAHLLNRNRVLYRISREAQVIHLHGDDNAVTFECAERERPLINTVMLELSSGIEQSLRELQQPLDDVLLRRNMQQAGAGGPASGGAACRGAFTPRALKPRLLATTKQGAIAELVSLLAEAGLVSDRDKAVRAVLEREQSLSTGLEFGVAIPHARTDAATRLACAVGLKQEGLDFDSMDGRPVRIVVLVLAPDSAASPQLQVVAQVCRLLDERGRAALLACDTAEDMYGVLCGGAGTAAAAAPHGAALSPLAATVQWQSVALDLAAAGRQEALQLLLALCARSGAVAAAEEVRAALNGPAAPAPERVGAEAALFALETPHVDRAVAAVGLCPHGIALDNGAPCRACAMLLYPPSAAAEAARVKAALARALDAPGLAALLGVKTGKEALEVLLRV